MARRPMLSLFGSVQNRPTQAEEASARTSDFVESLLCIAIRKTVRVKCRYKDDSAERLFEHVVMYLSDEHKLCVRGVEVVDAETPSDNLPVHTFEVREIKSVSLTEQAFVTNPVIDRFDPTFTNGIVCTASKARSKALATNLGLNRATANGRTQPRDQRTASYIRDPLLLQFACPHASNF